MRDVLGKSLKIMKYTRKRNSRISTALILLSFVVALDVFWILRQPALTMAGDATCGIVEHTHDDACRVQVCSCDLSEEAHIHEEACYEITRTEGSEEVCLICEETSESHEHTEACYTVKVTEAREEQILSCDISEEPHIHNDACYTWELLCGSTEHIHSIMCYADETADVETPLDWQEMFAGYPYTKDLRQDLAGIAKTQVGYCESALNFTVDSNGIRQGYTRYGAWYGAPYGDWSAMFVSFCLHYAGADPEEFPGNTGADSMATIWNSLGKYTQAGTYFPCEGDLVFFEDNRVGIVSDVQNTTFYAICGDTEDAVTGTVLSVNDESITGWGMIAGAGTDEADIPSETAQEESETQTDLEESKILKSSALEIEESELPDVSNGPVFSIYAESKEELSRQRFTAGAPRAATDMRTYLQNNGGAYSFMLVDTNNMELPKDAAGNYIVTAGVNYKLTLIMNSPNGLAPGTYQYQLPAGLQIHGGNGNFILKDGTNVGTWLVADDGLITMVFNENINNRTDVTISATMGVAFSEAEAPMDFDGKITVTVSPPAQEENPTGLNKWGVQGDAEKGQDPSKIYWTVEITGHKDSAIPGSIITDEIKTGKHSYTETDIAGGLHFGVGEYDLQTGEQVAWHAWDVLPDDPDLTWDESGWSYKIPEQVKCKWCPQPVQLGSNGWTYYIEYTSTPEASGATGTLQYTNGVMIDGQYVDGWGSFEHGDTEAGIIKNGSFHGDANGGMFHWEVQATIPGRKPGERAAYYTQIMDHLRIKDAGNTTIAYIHNDADQAKVTAVYNGQNINVPHVNDAVAADQFAWVVGWSSENNGVYYTRALLPLHRCDCNEQTCHYWNAGLGRCDALHYQYGEWGAYPSGFCYCWTPEQNITFTFSYETNDPEVIEIYGGQDNILQNEAVLQHTVYQPDGTESTITIGDDVADVPIPGVFKKELTHDFDGYTANYKITVNEGKLVLTNGSPLTIHDEMTQTLAYISGSLVITTEDANGNTGELHQDVDYTVTYDGTGNKTDEKGNPVHVLDIVILRPQPVMYVLDYDATLVIPPGTTQAVKYSNSASITLWGEDISDESDEKIYTDINISAMNYRVELYKTDSQTGEPLAGATFGLFNAHGGLIISGETDAKGELRFETNVTQGVILREHVLYYMQEQKAPPGYLLDDTQYWFCFCNSNADSCKTCDGVMAGLQAVRIPSEQIGRVHVENELMHYDLPSTGGSGIYPIVFMSSVFIIIPLVYEFIRRCKQERRGVG